MFLWGSAKWGQLGGSEAQTTGNDVKASLLPRQLIPPDSRGIVSVAAGDGHTLVATTDGDVLSFGRGREGQLGLGAIGPSADRSEPQLIHALGADHVVEVACGALHSLCRTEAGRVYLWGLIHADDEEPKAAAADAGAAAAEEEGDKENEGEDDDESKVAGVEGSPAQAAEAAPSASTHEARSNGTRIGGASDRAAAEAASGDARAMLGLGDANETLRRIVKSSTERWLTAEEEDLDDEGHDDGGSGGGVTDGSGGGGGGGGEGRAKDEQHAAADVGITSFNLDARRRPVPEPKLCASLFGLKIVALSAGYGHNLALSADGRVFSCGYNDRGQLGLGHRINCTEFQYVSALEGVFVCQIACGQAHNLARTTGTRPSHPFEAAAARDKTEAAGSLAGATKSAGASFGGGGGGGGGGGVYVWGNGSLGQLGLGRRVTGRRVPVLLPSLSHDGLRIIDIAAGNNHSVAVSDQGEVWTWGHGEYGQHGGQTSVSTSDLVDAFHYYQPRPLVMDPGVKIVNVECGSCFSLGRTESGDVYSWGWNGHGVLGHGKGYFSHAPTRIAALGSIDRKVVSIAAGANMCAAVVESSQCPIQYRYLLDQCQDAANGLGLGTCDVIMRVPGFNKKPFFGHRIILESRCRFLRGYLRAAEQDGEHTEVVDSSRSILSVVINTKHATVTTLAALLVYVYTEKLEVPPHKLRELMSFASETYMERLEALCAASIQLENSSRLGMVLKEPVVVPAARFDLDMRQAVNEGRHADVCFVSRLPQPPGARKEATSTAMDATDIDASGAGISALSADPPSPPTTVLMAHKCVLAKIPFFKALLSDTWREGQRADGFEAGEGAATTESSPVAEVDITGFTKDGVRIEIFSMLLDFIYTGSESVIPESPNDITELVVAAERVGVTQLVRLCERDLIVFLANDTESNDNSRALSDFARAFNLRRLARHIDAVMTLS